ncbi:conserved hypothetical protein [Neospora caninum Liverpool]|uniref:Uncharacterized protein n=1 Tax=Neospora caninum (strain Liverpool) TaxID=572307 RepID=F0VJS3_NEOCL|nr:conserved hypothetical protein [Neospora caninum Liverpool]CBZ53984.1 conserved hypothetical protein [Neospora caninum Liverpool]|eukprot:XP_003884016.1 conserved hypothetical protein [Neospora caninum Liverpool]
MALLFLSSGGSVPQPPTCVSPLFPPSGSLSACQWGSPGSVPSTFLRSTSSREPVSSSTSHSSFPRPHSSLWKGTPQFLLSGGQCVDVCLCGDDAAANSCSLHTSSCGCGAERDSASAGPGVACGPARDLNTLQSGSAGQLSGESDDGLPSSNDETASRKFDGALKKRSGTELTKRHETEEKHVAPSSTSLKSLSTALNRSQHKVDDSGWERASSAWQRRAAPFRVTVYKKVSHQSCRRLLEGPVTLAGTEIQIGGGGDCMYHSIAACLKELEKFYPTFKALDMQAIRNAAADGFVGFRVSETSGRIPGADWDAEAFMGRLEVLAALEDEEWLESWSPSAVLSGDQYRNSAYMIMDTSTPEGKAAAVHFELSRPGSIHWGSGFDLEAIEDALNVGIVVLSHENGGVYPRAARTDVKRPYYILLYYYVSASENFAAED